MRFGVRGIRMLNLAEYRSKPQRLADFLPWAALVDRGVVLNKDGSFQRTAPFRGPDLESATPAELVAATQRLNNALRRLGSRWALFVEASRKTALSRSSLAVESRIEVVPHYDHCKRQHHKEDSPHVRHSP